MKRNMFALTALSFLLGFALEAKEFSFATPESWQTPAALQKKGNSLLVAGQKGLVGKRLIKVPEGASLKITGTFRAAPGSAKNTVYLGFKAYDINRNEIRHVNIAPVAGTETVLEQPAPAGEYSFLIKDGSKWKKGFNIVWGAKKDLSDLPNYNILGRIAKVEKAGNNWKVTLAARLKKPLPKGTILRLHSAGGYMYYVFMSTIPGAKDPRTNSIKKIWPGVRYVRFLVLANWKGGKNAVLEMIDPKVTVTEAVKK